MKQSTNLVHSGLLDSTNIVIKMQLYSQPCQRSKTMQFTKIVVKIQQQSLNNSDSVQKV